MRSRPIHALRLALSVALAAVCWLVAGSAHAAAPQCDERGAITFAPNPTLQEPNASVETSVDCQTPSLPTQAYEHGRSQGPEGSAAAAVRALPASPVLLTPAPLRAVLPPPAEVSRPPAGVCSRVERPPRA